MGKWTHVRRNINDSEVIMMYKDGAAVLDISDELKIKPSHIRSILNDNGIKLELNRFSSKSRRKRLLLDTNRIIKAYCSGKTPKEISNSIGCSDQTIRRILKKHDIMPGMNMRPKSYINHNKIINNETIINLHNAGMNALEISLKIGVTRHAVYVRLNNLGLKPNEHPNSFNLNEFRREQQLNPNAIKMLSDSEWLRRLYIEDLMPSREIAKAIGCGKKAVLSALRRHHIPIGSGSRKTIVNSRFGAISCDSWWEALFVKNADLCNKVTALIREPFAIPYDGHRLYFPDFLIDVDSKKIIVEIKPEGLIGYCIHKLDAAKKMCECMGIEFIIITDPANCNLW